MSQELCEHGFVIGKCPICSKKSSIEKNGKDVKKKKRTLKRGKKKKKTRTPKKVLEKYPQKKLTEISDKNHKTYKNDKESSINKFDIPKRKKHVNGLEVLSSIDGEDILLSKESSTAKKKVRTITKPKIDYRECDNGDLDMVSSCIYYINGKCGDYNKRNDDWSCFLKDHDLDKKLSKGKKLIEGKTSSSDKTVEDKRKSLKIMTVSELKEICKKDKEKYKGYSSLKKRDLIEHIIERSDSEIDIISNKSTSKKSKKKSKTNKGKYQVRAINFEDLDCDNCQELETCESYARDLGISLEKTVKEHPLVCRKSITDIDNNNDTIKKKTDITDRENVPRSSKEFEWISEYERLDEIYNTRMEEKYKDIVSPKISDKVPFDRWFPLKEAFSSTLIEHIINEFGYTEGGWIIDPFGGSGSTMVACRRNFLNGITFEINPVFSTIIKAKITDYDLKTLKSVSEKMISRYKKRRHSDENTDILKNVDLMQKLFGENLDDILTLMNDCNHIPDEKYKIFFLSALASIVEDCGYFKKDGNGLRYPENKEPLPVLETFKDKIWDMIEDIEAIQSMEDDKEKSKFLLFKKSCISTNLNKYVGKGIKSIDDAIGNIDFCITSPPYANCFDYTGVYKAELWATGMAKDHNDLNEMRKVSASSHLRKAYRKSPSFDDIPILEKVIESIWIKDEWSVQKKRRHKKTKKMIRNYFKEMGSLINNMFSIMKSGGFIVFVVGNSMYTRVPIATDIFIAILMEKAGFKNVEIRTARNLKTSVQQMKGLDDDTYLRESLVIGKK
jgi:hypothetical protein